MRELTGNNAMAAMFALIGFLLLMHGLRGKPWAGQPELPPTREELASAKPPAKLERAVSALVGLVLLLYGAYGVISHP